MNLEDYCSAILEQYPEYITKEQMYRICHISKKTCLFLLESGLVPNIDSGKKTCRFKIKTVDVIQYLKTRDKAPARFQVPNGYYSSTNVEKSGEKLLSYDEEFPPETVACMRRFYEEHLAKYPDVMSVRQVAKFTGYCTNSVGR